MKDCDCKEALLKIIDKLSCKAVKRLYQLAEYLYIYAEGGSNK